MPQGGSQIYNIPYAKRDADRMLRLNVLYVPIGEDTDMENYFEDSVPHILILLKDVFVRHDCKLNP